MIDERYFLRGEEVEEIKEGGGEVLSLEKFSRTSVFTNNSIHLQKIFFINFAL
jgi:hypothetical protein